MSRPTPETKAAIVADYAETVAQIRELRRAWRQSADAYAEDPHALTRVLNDNDGAAARMRAHRAKDRP